MGAAVLTLTAFTFGEDGVCRLDPTTLEWNAATGARARPPSALVYDSINDRPVLIQARCCGPWDDLPSADRYAIDDIWAVNVDTSQWTQLLAPSDE